MRAQRALAAAGGAGREEDVGDVVGLDRCGANFNGLEGSGFLAPRDELVPGSVVLLDRYPDDVAEFRQGVAVYRSRIVGAEEFSLGIIAAFHQPRQFARDRRRVRDGGQGPEEGDEPAAAGAGQDHLSATAMVGRSRRRARTGASPDDLPRTRSAAALGAPVPVKREQRLHRRIAIAARGPRRRRTNAYWSSSTYARAAF